MNGEPFNPKLQGVSLTGNGDSLVTDGVCKHYTTPAHILHFRTHEFCRVGQVQVVCVLLKRSSSLLVCHVSFMRTVA